MRRTVGDGRRSSAGFTRREFNRLLLASSAAMTGWWGCSGDGAYTDADAERLAARMREEKARSGTGPYGPLRYRGYRGLAELPYFELDERGRLRLTVEGLPAGIDFHSHLGMNFLFAPDIDLLRRSERVRYLLDCDAETPGCALDLDVYINSAFDERLHAEMSREVRNQILFGSDAAATHTIPNLLDEMDAVGFERAAILAVDPGLPFGGDLTARWFDAVEQAGASQRLLVFASVHPSDSGWREKLRAYARRGARGLKLHPEMQRFFPDDPRAMEIYEECERLGLVVIYHAGRSGIEPGFMRKYALMRRYEAPAAEFPRVQFAFGHAGARDVADAMALARRYPNVWLEITGQGATQLDAITRENDPNRLLFGSDWPFYPLAATLAKVLLVTETRPELRPLILRENALRAFAAAADSGAASISAAELPGAG
jgi:predicted TIM-barrel fold metal-dependent hydrolase